MKVIKHFIRPRSIWTSGFCLLLLGGCGRGADHKGKKVFTYNESDGIATLDPAFAKNRSIIWAVHQLYSTLVETDDKLNIVPCLARSWEVSADRRTWTFHLRKAQWSDGTAVTPKDFVAAWRRLELAGEQEAAFRLRDGRERELCRLEFAGFAGACNQLADGLAEALRIRFTR